MFVVAEKWRPWEGCRGGWLPFYETGQVSYLASVVGLRAWAFVLILLPFLLCQDGCPRHESIGRGGLTDGQRALPWPLPLPVVEGCRANRG